MRKAIGVLLLGGGLVSALGAADLTGDWTGERRGPSGEARSLTLHLRVEGATLTGTANGLGGSAGEVEMSEGSVNGDQVSFSLVRGQFKMKYQGTVTDNAIHFKLMREPGESSTSPVE